MIGATEPAPTADGSHGFGACRALQGSHGCVCKAGSCQNIPFLTRKALLWPDQGGDRAEHELSHQNAFSQPCSRARELQGSAPGPVGAGAALHISRSAGRLRLCTPLLSSRPLCFAAFANIASFRLDFSLNFRSSLAGRAVNRMGTSCLGAGSTATQWLQGVCSALQPQGWGGG